MSTCKSTLHTLAALVTGQLEPQLLSSQEAQAVVSLALQHGLEPMLLWTVKRAGIDTADPVWAPLVTSARKAAVRYMQLKSAQATVQAALTAAGIPTIWLKGFALAHTVYPHPALRPMGDLDVLVPFAQREAALAIAESIGYRANAPPLINSLLRDVEHHYHLRWNLADTVILELHYHLFMWSEKLLPLSQLEWFWHQMRRYSSHGVEFTSFTPEAHLLHLCVHTVLHGSDAFLLRRCLDLHLLVTHYPTLNWQLVVDQAVKLKWTCAVEQALTVTQEYFATRLPDDLLTELEHRRPAQEFISHVTLHLSPISTVRRCLNNLAAMRWSFALRLIVGTIFPSPAYMRWRYRVDASWKLPFYYLYRWLDTHKWRTR